MIIEYAARNKLDGARLSFRKAQLRAEADKLDALFEELKAAKGNQRNNARRPSARKKSILQSV